jgi:hypothetical protein
VYWSDTGKENSARTYKETNFGQVRAHEGTEIPFFVARRWATYATDKLILTDNSTAEIQYSPFNQGCSPLQWTTSRITARPDIRPRAQ